MSSWGWENKILKLEQVGDFFIFRSKSSLFIFTGSWEAFFCKKLKKMRTFLLFDFLCIHLDPMRHGICHGLRLGLRHEFRHGMRHGFVKQAGHRLCIYLSFCGGFKFRLGTYNVPSGFRPEHLKTRPKAEFDGLGGVIYQKCHLKIFILCGYIDKVYTYIYM